MNEAELAARGERAHTCYKEFISPAIAEQRAEYARRMTEIAITEMDPKLRAEKITTVATALRILENIDRAIHTLVEDGKMAQAAMLKIDYVDRMTAPRRRLFEFTPH